MNVDVSLIEFPLCSPAVICRGVQPDGRSPSAGEHCEEGRSFPSADHEPKADQAGGLHRKRLSKPQITLLSKSSSSGERQVRSCEDVSGFSLAQISPEILKGIVHLTNVDLHLVQMKVKQV